MMAEGSAEDDYNCLKLENQLCFPLYVCSKEIIKQYRPYLEPLGITYTQYITMMVLWEERSLSVKDIGERLSLDSGTLTPLLRKLEDKGYLIRHRDTSDERNLIVSVTEAGMDLREKAKHIPGSVGSCISMSKEEATILKGILDRLMSSFGSSD